MAEPRPPDLGWVSAGMLTPVVAVLRDRGHAITEVLAAGNLSVESLRDPTHRITLRAATLVWRKALETAGDPAFGLHAAVLCTSGDFDLLLCLARTCGTLEQALRLSMQYAVLLDESIACTLAVRDGRCTLSLGRRSVRYLPAVAEYVLGRLVLMARELLGEDSNPLEVRFAHRKPKRLELHRKLFKAPVSFGCPEVALVFDAAVLERRLPLPDPVLQRVLEPYARQLLGKVQPKVSFAQRVQVTVSELLPRGVPSRSEIARRLAVGPRTLARRLDQEGTTYSDLVDDLRIDLATRYLQAGTLTVSEIASELGFRDQSAFTKSFRRWLGVTPSEYRRRGNRNGSEPGR